ncbi:hypothetical protein AB1Y20_020568 [Prymnesium parvum]|uniref:Transmembrane protein n=1 Tax=Prymnesium parvum TaxID=97485 RepID=A0AB34JVJ2_PRYPA
MALLLVLALSGRVRSPPVWRSALQHSATHLEERTNAWVPPHRRAPLSALKCSTTDEAPNLRSTALASLPILGCLAAGAPWFAVVYTPLIFLSRQVGAPTAAAACASSLLYSSGAALLGLSSPQFELPMFVASLCALAAQLSFSAPDQPAGTDFTEEQLQDDDFTSFDFRLKERIARRTGQTPKSGS